MYRLYKYLAIDPVTLRIYEIAITETEYRVEVGILSQNHDAYIEFSLKKRTGESKITIHVGLVITEIRGLRKINDILNQIEHLLTKRLIVIATIKEYEGDESPYW
ncbi:MAG: hypothetical protein GXO68_05760 [Crenarchaeota archaeon]|nr:hypothetical protein [Thermoproteota archaeon]